MFVTPLLSFADLTVEPSGSGGQRLPSYFNIQRDNFVPALGVLRIPSFTGNTFCSRIRPLAPAHVPES